MTTLPQETVVSPTMTDQLIALHENYVVAVNEAVAADDYTRVDGLARDFDRDALELMTQHLRHRAA